MRLTAGGIRELLRASWPRMIVLDWGESQRAPISAFAKQFSPAGVRCLRKTGKNCSEVSMFRLLLNPAAKVGLAALALSLAACSSEPSSGGGLSYLLSASLPSPSTVTAGNASSSTITLTPANGYTGSITLSCSVAGATPLPTCSFSNSPVAITGAAPVTTTLTVSTTENTPGGSYTIAVTGFDSRNAPPSDGPQTLVLTTAAVIQHIVIIFQENRTPDNLFQDPMLISHGADIVSSGINSLGQTVPLSPIDLGTSGANPQNYDLSHTHSAFVSMYDGGKMDGANLIPCSPAAACPPNAHPNPQFMYVMPSDVQPYFAMAEQYVFGDRMFQTNQGPSFPAHQFILSGTSAPATGSNLFAAENPNKSPAGCIAPPTETVALIDPFGSESSNPPIYPCFEHLTLSDELDTAGITWRYYAPSAGSIWTAPDAIQHICQQQTVNGVLTCTGPDWTGNVVIPQSQVLVDLANHQLSQVTWVIPDGQESDHALSNDGSGPSWVASIVNSIGSSTFWANTAIIITWDDWGGWYDHVPPKVVDDGVSWGSGYVYGFRVPLIIISPYAKPAYISHATHDFGSILHFVETTFHLPSLGYADAAADDFSDCFNLTQRPLSFQTISAPLNATYFLNDKRPPADPDDD
jgi:phospholipase C